MDQTVVKEKSKIGQVQTDEHQVQNTRVCVRAAWVFTYTGVCVYVRDVCCYMCTSNPVVLLVRACIYNGILAPMVVQHLKYPNYLWVWAKDVLCTTEHQHDVVTTYNEKKDVRVCQSCD